MLGIGILACTSLSLLIAAGETSYSRPFLVDAPDADLAGGKAGAIWSPILQYSGDPEFRRLLAVHEGRLIPTQALVSFLHDHPRARSKAFLHAELGTRYRGSGAFLASLHHFEAAWTLLKASVGFNPSDLRDYVVAELAQLRMNLGQAEALEGLIEQVGSLSLRGQAGVRFEECREALKVMKANPERVFRCGPAALELMASKSKTCVPAMDGMRDRMPVGPVGASFEDLLEEARRNGFSVRLASAQSLYSIPPPAVLHSKADHFVVLVGKDRHGYQIHDFVNVNTTHIDQSIFESEYSPFALVQEERSKGLVLVDRGEGLHLHGKGYTDGQGDVDPDGDDEPSCKPDSHGMPIYSLSASSVSLQIKDIPLWYQPALGRSVEFKLSYSQRGAHSPGSRLGPNWSHNWDSQIETKADVFGGQLIYCVIKWIGINEFGGGLARYYPTASEVGKYVPTIKRYTDRGTYLLTRSPDDFKDCRGITTAELHKPDGSIDYYSSSGLGAPRLVSRVDSNGQATKFVYDASGKLTEVKDAAGGVTSLTYNDAGTRLIRVTDPFGRSTSLSYNGAGQLASITDMGGLTTVFSYGPTPAAPAAPVDFLNGMTTPYGTTSFAGGNSGVDRWLEVTDPHGNRERMEFRNQTSGMPAAEKNAPVGYTNNWLYYRNTFYWDKRVMTSGPPTWANAKIYHWLHQAGTRFTSSLPESKKTPNTSRVWYHYGQGVGKTHEEGPSSWPLETIQFPGDGSTVKNQLSYNSLGKVTKATDAVGRETSYIYTADGLDVTEVRNTTSGRNELLASYTYNALRRPLTVTDSSGQVTSYTYTPVGQVASITNPLGETTTLQYNASHRLQAIQGPLSAATTFTYDGYGRLATTVQDGETIAFDYDALDRKTRTTYSDGTWEETTYHRLDPQASRDRLGRWTLFRYNALRQLVEVMDPEGRTTSLGWCGCGSLESLQDPGGKFTLWSRNLEGQVTSKILDDLSRTDYSYDGAGRLNMRIDAKAQLTSYKYYPDGNLKEVTYDNASVLTPGVAYTYDGVYNRLATMVDGIGTTTYSYHSIGTPPALGAGRLAAVQGPLSNSTLSYTYDALGRVVGRTIGGNAETRGFDALGRLVSIQNPLGAFSYTYEGTSSRLMEMRFPNGQKSTFAYDSTRPGNRLQAILNARQDGSTISRFAYAYDVSGQIQTWIQQSDAQTPKVFSFQYDGANQLTQAILTQGSPQGAIIKKYLYGYDASGNRTSEQVDQLVKLAEHNRTNQLIRQTTTEISAPSAPLGRIGSTSIGKVPARKSKRSSTGK